MSEEINNIISKTLAGGCTLACCCCDDAFGLFRALSAEDPVPDAGNRPVFYWDSTDGLSGAGVDSSLAEGLSDAMEALEYVRKFSDPAIFVVNLDGVAVAEEEAAFRRQIKMIGGTFTPAAMRVLVLVSTDPLPADIAKLCERIGYPVEAPATPSSAARPEGPWREIRQLEKFSGHDWTRRLDTMSEQDVAEIADGEHHREAVRRVQELREALKNQFARKDEIIDLMVYAAVGQVPMVLLGPPGTAKSNLVRNLCSGLGLVAGKGAAAPGEEPQDGNGAGGGGLFEYLLTRYTTPEEIFGPVHIPDLINKRVYRRVTEGRLPNAEVAFLDEIFKASSAIVNSLLTILNERIFHNGDHVQQVPMVMVFAASNEPPQDPSLRALYDRFPIRANCGRVDDEHVTELWERTWQLTFDRWFKPQRSGLPQLACVNDLRLLHRVALWQFGGRSPNTDGFGGGFNFSAEFLRIFRSLRRDYDLSDRAIGALYALARAKAVVDGRTRLSVEELDVFRTISWDESGTGDLDRLVSNLKRGVST